MPDNSLFVILCKVVAEDQLANYFSLRDNPLKNWSCESSVDLFMLQRGNLGETCDRRSTFVACMQLRKTEVDGSPIEGGGGGGVLWAVGVRRRVVAGKEM